LGDVTSSFFFWTFLFHSFFVESGPRSTGELAPSDLFFPPGRPIIPQHPTPTPQPAHPTPFPRRAVPPPFPPPTFSRPTGCPGLAPFFFSLHNQYHVVGPPFPSFPFFIQASIFVVELPFFSPIALYPIFAPSSFFSRTQICKRSFRGTPDDLGGVLGISLFVLFYYSLNFGSSTALWVHSPVSLDEPGDFSPPCVRGDSFGEPGRIPLLSNPFFPQKFGPSPCGAFFERL